MPATLSPTQYADLRRHQDDVSFAPKEPPVEDALEALSKLTRRATFEPTAAPATSGRLFAGPRKTEPSVEPGPRPVDFDEGLGRDMPFSKRLQRGLIRFFTAVLIGVAGTLVWQSYGDTAQRIIAREIPLLAWFISVPASNSPSTPQSLDPQYPKAIAGDLAALRQTIEQVATRQEQLSGEIAGLQKAQDELRRSISAPLWSAAAPGRKPAVAPPAEHTNSKRQSLAAPSPAR
jgi:hypothetical protein